MAGSQATSGVRLGWPLAALAIGALTSLAVFLGMEARETAQCRAAAKELARETLEILSKVVEQETSALYRMGERWNAVGGMPKLLWSRDAASHIRDFAALSSIARSDKDFVIRWVQNREGRVDAVNFDLKSRPDRYDQLRYLRRASAPASSGPVTLRYGPIGFIYDVPLNGRDGSPDGFLHGVFEYKELVRLLPTVEFRNLPEDLKLWLLVNNKPILNTLPKVLPGHVGRYQRQILGENWDVRVLLSAERLAEKKTSWPLIVSLLIFALTCFLALALYFRQTSIHDAATARIAESRLNEALDALDTPFAYFDEDNRLRIWNNAYLDMHAGISDLIRDGVPYEELLRGLVSRGLAKNALGREEEYIEERLRLHGTGDFRGERQLSNGRWVTSRKLRAADGGVVAIWTDVTRLKEQQAALIRARNVAEDASRAKSEFLANMSHELRTPLNAINGFSEVISEQLFGPVTDKYRNYARDINSSGKHLLALINDILDLSKIEAGALHLDEEAFGLDRLVENLRRMTEDSARAKNLSLHWPDEASEIVVRGDFRLLLQVFVNLMSNAIKFTPENGAVTVDVVRRDGEFDLVVSDNGVGMTAEETVEAMQPFVQVGAANHIKAQGTGLGLSLVQKFIELHDGDFSIDSTPGDGTTVTVRLYERVYAGTPHIVVEKEAASA